MNAAPIVFAKEPLLQAASEACALFVAHWEETEAAYRPRQLRPDWPQIERMVEAGWVRFFTARVDGALVGHLCFVVFPSRFTSTITASEDFFFLLKDFRRGMNAIKLLRFAVQALRDEGVGEICMSSKLTAGHDIGPILRRVGFRHVADSYVM